VAGLAREEAALALERAEGSAVGVGMEEPELIALLCSYLLLEPSLQKRLAGIGIGLSCSIDK
jgi:hypothetical protein